MIFWIDAEKAFDKTQHSFLIKTLKKVGIEGSYLEIIKAIYERPNASIILNGKTESFRPKVRNKTGMSTLATVIQHSIGSLSLSSETAQRNKRHPNQEEVKISLFTDDMILYMENPEDSTKKLLELIHEFRKVAGYKVNAQKSVAFLYTNSAATEREIKNRSHFQLHQKP